MEENIEFYTVGYWQQNWDDLMQRVENGEVLGIIGEDGNKAVMVPADHFDMIKMYTDHNEAS